MVRLNAVDLDVSRKECRVWIDKGTELGDDVSVFEENPADLTNGTPVGVARFDIEREEAIEHDGSDWLNRR